jgi:YesN/AraC family two-component response regulator
VNELKSKVMLVLEERKLFLDPSLTLTDLSREVGIGIHELSYVINNELKKNFYNLINEMRVEEAKMILLSEKIKYSDMIGIAIEVPIFSRNNSGSEEQDRKPSAPGGYECPYKLF